MQAEWALNHKRQNDEIWRQNIEYQQHNPGLNQSWLENVFWLGRREYSNDTVFMVAEDLFCIQIAH